jgi:ribose transport system substrate-binding protein
VIAVGALTLAACSSSGSSSESSAAPASSEAAASEAPASEAPASEAPADGVPQSVLDNLAVAKALPTFTAQGEPFSIADVKGKKIFEIPAVPNPFLQSISDAMKTAAEGAGAVYTICDNQAEVSCRQDQPSTPTGYDRSQWRT